ncbi:MAG: hypothetical protein E7I13_04180 [Negativicoccus succinicivorans]|nr:hypothetical protein [Negativicoccus succinicivorans]MDU4202917.1 hypothetical protein [Negativicoccus succinicivorans]MDU5656942.1 hypothetical protein [Negativicoccus succinicivorans]
MKNIDEKILMAEEEIKRLQNKRKKLISQQKQEERKKRDRRLYENGLFNIHLIKKRPATYGKGLFFNYITIESYVISISCRNKICMR